MIPLLSMIVPVKNEQSNIVILLDKILNQTSEKICFEIVIVDDHSTDLTYFQVLNYCKYDDRIIAFQSDKYGAGAARNIGIKEASGKYIYFIDADDTFIGFKRLAMLLDAADKKDVMICGGSIEIRDEGCTRERKELPKEYFFEKEGFIDYSDYQFDYGFTRFIYRRDFLVNNRIFFPEISQYEDPIFMRKAFFAAKKFYVIPDDTYIINAHRKENWSEENVCDMIDGMRENMDFSINKGYPKLFSNTIKRVFTDFSNAWSQNPEISKNFTDNIVDCVRLQNVIFPDRNIIYEPSLYYACNRGGLRNNGKEVIIYPFSEISFNTYFNSFSAGKWSKYSKVKSGGLLLDIEGNHIVTLYHNYIRYGKVVTTVIGHLEINCNKRRFTYLDIGEFPENGTVSFTIESLEDRVQFYGGCYIDTSMAEKREINLAIITTTYKREEYVKKNYENIVALNCCSKHLYIVDNAGTLDINEVEDCSVIKNKNVGGSGGFATGMMRAIDDLPSKHYTHCILMDDDIVLDTKVIERLYVFLSLEKEMYYEYSVAGAMLRIDSPYLQVEASATWNGGQLVSYGNGFDLREARLCLENEEIHEADYGAWWFCVLPMSVVRNDNLPLPLFVNCDDVDYGLRMKKSPITLNGICVWHEAFETKLTASKLYYAVRNELIINGIHGYGTKKSVIKSLDKKIITELCLYRYGNAEAIIEAMGDYLKGPDFIAECNAEQLNRSIRKMNSKAEQIENLNFDFDYKWYQLCCTIEDCDVLHRIIRIITLNGLLLRANREFILPPYANRIVQGYRASRIMFFDEITGIAYVTSKDIKKIITLLAQYKHARSSLKHCYYHALEGYKNKYIELHSRNVWENYLRNS